MTDTPETPAPKRRGRPAKYPFAALNIGETFEYHAPTIEDVKSIYHRAGNYAAKGKRFTGRINRETRVITFTRIL